MEFDVKARESWVFNKDDVRIMEAVGFSHNFAVEAFVKGTHCVLPTSEIKDWFGKNHKEVARTYDDYTNRDYAVFEYSGFMLWYNLLKYYNAEIKDALNQKVTPENEIRLAHFVSERLVYASKIITLERNSES